MALGVEVPLGQQMFLEPRVAWRSMLSTGTEPDSAPVSPSKLPEIAVKPARNVAIAWWVMEKRAVE